MRESSNSLLESGGGKDAGEAEWDEKLNPFRSSLFNIHSADSLAVKLLSSLCVLHDLVQLTTVHAKWHWLHLFVMTSKALTHRDYLMRWVCALTKKLTAITVMLNKRHSDLSKQSSDQNVYTLESIDDHNIAIACLSMSDIGNNSAATVATRMINTFSSIRFWLMIGIDGEVPSKVRLGDVVISTSVYEYSEVVQWDIGIAQDESFRRIEALNKPSEVLRSAMRKLKTHREIHGLDTGILHILEELRLNNQSFAFKYLRFEHLKDNLFRSDFNHVDQSK